MPSFRNAPGATPLGDVSHLIPQHLQTQAQLDEFEARNIAQAARKYLLKHRKFSFTVAFLKRVHKEMFGETWVWAGIYRDASMNLGVEPMQIQVEMYKLSKDIEYWEKENTLNLLERSVRLHHRLVKIHPFPNGNGRHARFVSDIYLFGRGEKMPTWPNQELVEHTDIRARYIRAMQAADKGDYKQLEAFTQDLIK
jgi:Fic-DOC domain mobile mystery protein B